MSKDKKMATDEQMKEIDSLVSQVGLGQDWNDFARQMYSMHDRKDFAKSLTSTLSGLEQIALQAGHDGIYQPILSQDLLQDININPSEATSAKIEQMLLSPQKHYKQLSSINQYLAYAVGVYRRNIWYNNTIKSFKYDLKPINIPMDGTFDKDEYLKSYEKAMNVLRKLNVKYQFKKADLQVMYDGFVCYWINETSDNYTFVPLPSEACFITAPYTFGWRVAFDLAYFDRYNLGIDAIPELKHAYEDFVDRRQAFLEGKKDYKGQLTVSQYYSLPVKNTAVFTFDPIHPDRVPPLASAMGSAVDILSYKKLLKDQLALDLFKLLSFEIPLNKDTNKPSIEYNQASLIIQAIKSMLPENVVPFASPFKAESISVDQTKKYEDIIKISNDSYYSASGATQSVFGSAEIKQGTAIKIATDVDFMYVSSHMYEQYNNCINSILWNTTGKYKFRVSFFGNSLTDKTDVMDYANLVRTANMPVSKLFAYEDYEPFEIYGALKSEDILGIKDMMKPLVSGFNTKGGVVEGQPTKNRVSDGGEISRDYGDDE